jgi:hypothetical protein
LELVTKVEAGFAAVAGAAAVVEAEDDAVLPAEAVDGVVPAEAVDGVLPAEAVDGVVPADVEAAAVELVVALDDVVAAELSEPQPPRAANKETHTNPEHTLSVPIWKIIVTCPIAA